MLLTEIYDNCIGKVQCLTPMNYKMSKAQRTVCVTFKIPWYVV